MADSCHMKQQSAMKTLSQNYNMTVRISSKSKEIYIQTHINILGHIDAFLQGFEKHLCTGLMVAHSKGGQPQEEGFCFSMSAK